MTGIERLNLMLAGELDLGLIKIVKYLKTLTDIDENVYLNEEKNLHDMYDYIKSKAKDNAVNGVAMIEDKTVYEWAKKYFLESNEVLGFKKVEPKPTISNSNARSIQTNNVSDKEQLSLNL